MRLFLASRSPRRRELLQQIGVGYDLLDLDVPEVRAPGEPPEDYVSRVAREKAGAGLMQVAAVPGAVVLGADTEVVLGNEVFGKPADADDAAAMLARLAGRRHRVLSAVWLVSAEREEHALSESIVEFAPMSAAEIAADSGDSVEAVRSRLTRAREAFRDRFSRRMRTESRSVTP